MIYYILTGIIALLLLVGVFKKRPVSEIISLLIVLIPLVLRVMQIK